VKNKMGQMHDQHMSHFLLYPAGCCKKVLEGVKKKRIMSTKNLAFQRFSVAIKECV
jgi:hypothetical protein